MFNAWLLLPAYFLMFSFTAVFFNKSIIFITKEEWNKVALISFISQTLFGIGTILTVVMTNDSFKSVGEQIGYIFASSAVMALSTSVATAFVGWQSNKKLIKENSNEQRVQKLEKQISLLKKKGKN